jgi:hypothetical protein
VEPGGRTDEARKFHLAAGFDILTPDQGQSARAPGAPIPGGSTRLAVTLPGMDSKTPSDHRPGRPRLPAAGPLGRWHRAGPPGLGAPGGLCHPAQASPRLGGDLVWQV